MKGKFLVLLAGCLLLATDLVQAQKIGVNTVDPKSSLHVKGVTNSDHFLLEDENGKRLIVVDKKGQTSVRVGSPKTDKSLETDRLKLEGLALADTNVYRNVLVIDTIGQIESIPYDRFIRSTPLPNVLKYSAKTVLIDGNIATTSVTELGVLRVRYRLDPNPSEANKGVGYIEFQVKDTNDYTLYWEKAGDTGSSTPGETWVGYRFALGNVTGYPTVSHTDSTWETFKRRTGTGSISLPDPSVYKVDNFNYAARDIVSAIILLDNSQKIYRVTALSNGVLDASSTGAHRVSSSITFFIEELKGS